MKATLAKAAKSVLGGRMIGFPFFDHNRFGCELRKPDPGEKRSAIAKMSALFQICECFFKTDQGLTFVELSPISLPPRGDLAGRLAATLNKSLKGRADPTPLSLRRLPDSEMI